MAKTAAESKPLAELLSGKNLGRIMSRAVKNALKENLRLNVPIPVAGKDGKVVYLKPEDVVKVKPRKSA